jgi:transposase
MKPHPLEFRQRIVAAVDQQEHTIAEVAALFGVSERYVYQLLKLRRINVSINTVWRGLQQIDFTLKKSPAAPRKPARKSEPRSPRNK